MSLPLVEPSPEKQWLLCVLLSNLKMHRSIHPLGLCASSALLFLPRYTQWEVSRLEASFAHGALSCSVGLYRLCLYSAETFYLCYSKKACFSPPAREGT